MDQTHPQHFSSGVRVLTCMSVSFHCLPSSLSGICFWHSSQCLHTMCGRVRIPWCRDIDSQTISLHAPFRMRTSSSCCSFAAMYIIYDTGSKLVGEAILPSHLNCAAFHTHSSSKVASLTQEALAFVLVYLSCVGA